MTTTKAGSKAAGAVKEERKSVDWEAMEPHWRAGIKTKLELSKEFGVSRAAMDKHFAKLGIDRDLTAKIQARAETIVAQQAVTESVTRNRLAATERDIVEANANVQVQAQTRQRGDVAKALGIVGKLMDSLDGQIDFRDDLEQLGELLRSEDKNGVDKLNDLYQKVVSFSGNVDNSKKLMESLRIGVELQRKVLRIKDDDATPADGIAALIGSLGRSAIKPRRDVDDE